MSDMESINPISALQWRTGSLNSSSSIPKVDWPALKTYALRLRRSQWQGDGPAPFSSCVLLPYYNKGGLHLVRLLEFDDGERWVARVGLLQRKAGAAQEQENEEEAQEEGEGGEKGVKAEEEDKQAQGPEHHHQQHLQQHHSDDHAACNLKNEVDTLALLREKSSIPVPRVYGYECTGASPVGVPFMLLEFVYGDTAMDLYGGYDVHQGKIPQPFRGQLIKNTATVQAELASLRFPKIGRIVRLDDGSYTVGPFPDLGGPFSTAAEYLIAWARHARFPWSGRELQQLLPRGYRNHLTASIGQFPEQLAGVAEHLSLRSGPFPLYHADLLHSNIIVDPRDCRILSVIDWEGASTVPWEVVEFPLFLTTTPPPMDAPWNYDEDGLPTIPNVRILCQEKEEYLRHVKRAEMTLGTDQRLSTTLENAFVQNLAGALKLYLDPGKIGFYCEVLEHYVEYLDANRELYSCR